MSALLNSPSGQPSLFDKTSSRRIYKLETNNSRESFYYVKYASAKKKNWVFNFTLEEVKKLEELYAVNFRVKLVLICLKEGLVGCEMAIINYDKAMDCLGVYLGVKTYRVNIKAIDGKHGLRMYGSGRSDMIDGKDNTLRVDRNAINAL